jgi:predicted small metal-binding protein
MFTLSCKDLGNPACRFVAKANTEDGAVEKMIMHAKIRHTDGISKIGTLNDVVKIMSVRVRNA